MNKQNHIFNSNKYSVIVLIWKNGYESKRTGLQKKIIQAPTERN